MRTELLAKFGLPANAALADVQRAYKGLARKHHPDAGGDAERMREINGVRDQLVKLFEGDHDVIEGVARATAHDRAGTAFNGKSAWGEWVYDDRDEGVAVADPEDPWGDGAETETVTPDEVAGQSVYETEDEGEEVAGDAVEDELYEDDEDDDLIDGFDGDVETDEAGDEYNGGESW